MATAPPAGHADRPIDVKGTTTSADRETCWIDLVDPTRARVEEIGARFGLHELAIEDAESAHQRPKLEWFGDTMVVVAKPAVYDDERETILLGEVLLAMGPDFVVSVRHGVAGMLPGDWPADRSSADPGRPPEEPLDEHEPIDVVYDMLDAVVDGYQPIIDALAVDIVEIEGDVFSIERTNPAPRIYALKRQVLEMLHNVQPLIDPLDALTAGPGHHGDERLDEYFRDVADHVRRLTTQLHTVNNTLSDVLQANLAQVSVSQNDDMRTMSAWAAIFLVPSLLAGVWGMNFDDMPELDWRFGYPIALATMVLTSVALWWQFRRTGWLGPPRSNGARGSFSVRTRERDSHT